MKSDQYIHFRDIIIIIAGFFGVAWFFFDYGNHHTKSTAEMNFTPKEVISRADSLFKEIDYQTLDLNKRVTFRSSSIFIDSLQESLGRNNLISEMHNDDSDYYPFFYWDLRIGDRDVAGPFESLSESSFSLRFSEKGKLVEFEASDEIVRAQTPFNRFIIRDGMLGGRADKALEDSLITALVNYQHVDTNEQPLLNAINLPSLLKVFNKMVASEIDEARLQGMIWGLAEYYVEKSHWSTFDLQQDSLSFSDSEGIRVASAHYTIKDAGMGLSGNLLLEVLPAGSLKKMEVTLPITTGEEGSTGEVRSALILILLFAFAVWLLVIFYLRIKAKVIDTRSSLIVALIAGFLVPLGVLIQDIVSLNFLYDSVGVTDIIQRIIQFGFAGAAGSILFFVITAVGDSITRQFWPEKLESFDLIRNGHINNKPVGWVVIRGVSLGLFGLGLFSMILWALPNLVIESNLNLGFDYVLLKPITYILESSLTGLGFMLITFLLVGNQVYGATNNKWYIPFVGALLFGILLPLGGNAYVFEGAIVSAILGFYIGYLYMRTDFLTTVVAFVTFLLILDLENAWLIEGSSENIVLYIIVSFFLILFGGGIYAIVKGEDVNVLPSYIPEYMEEIAQEQRIKQELRIAREVQFSFLPTTIPKVQNFELSGFCDPAQETGGDYFDMIKLNDHQVAIAIGDVSGKGIQAAFYMTFAKGVIHSLCSILNKPMDLISKANQLFNDNATRGTFISMIYGILDSKEKTFSFVRAGHNPILLKRKNGDMEWLQPKGMAIGMMKNVAFDSTAEEMVVDMKDNVECLVLYTDGITEAANKKNEFYGEDRLLKVVKNAKYSTSKDLIDIIIKDVAKFTGAAEQHDDITCVVIKAD